MDSLSVQKLYKVLAKNKAADGKLANFSYHLGRLSVVYSLQILLHSKIVILLLVQVVPKLPENDILL